MTATVTWVGHSTVLVEAGGRRLITDPALTRRLAHLRRRHPVPEVGPVDTLLLSHLHLDHLHGPSLRRVPPRDQVLVPTGGAGLLRLTGSPRVHEVRPGDRVILDDDTVTIDVVHAEHERHRGPHSRAAADPVGYVIREGGVSIYFAGDTGLFPGMQELGPVDVALLPIWGWGPTLGEKHLDPVTAAVAAGWIGARHVVPIHWGTYSPLRAGRGRPSWFERPLERFQQELEGAGLADRLRPLRPGSSLEVTTVR
jgi:L-ascorbate metabolism protein UlaG (beta-lactamase superfamily)